MKRSGLFAASAAANLFLLAVSAASASGALGHHDPATAALMVEGARWRLGLINERYDDPGSADARAELRAADLDLAAAIGAIRAGDPGANARLAVWIARSADWAGLLRREEARSLFDTGRLARAAARG